MKYQITSKFIKFFCHVQPCASSWYFFPMLVFDDRAYLCLKKDSSIFLLHPFIFKQPNLLLSPSDLLQDYSVLAILCQTCVFHMRWVFVLALTEEQSEWKHHSLGIRVWSKAILCHDMIRDRLCERIRVQHGEKIDSKLCTCYTDSFFLPQALETTVDHHGNKPLMAIGSVWFCLCKVRREWRKGGEQKDIQHQFQRSSKLEEPGITYHFIRWIKVEQTNQVSERKNGILWHITFFTSLLQSSGNSWSTKILVTF